MFLVVNYSQRDIFLTLLKSKIVKRVMHVVAMFFLTLSTRGDMFGGSIYLKIDF